MHENTDIRNFKITTKFDVIVADLSFISLEKILDTIISFGKSKSKFFVLIKPQFEVGKGNTKKGIVKDTTLVEDVLKKYETLSKEKNLRQIKIISSEIIGADGNQEYFLFGILK